ncbi:MAG: sugar transferase [Nitrospiraceae bacterium]|nr:sugar transferase [Nitrospiraceae bacterium]
MRRGLDIILSLAGLFVFSPLMALIAIAVKASDGGPVIFRQERVGMNFKPFSIYKFRTMKEDGRNINAPLVTFRGDNRITRVGAFLRRYKLDELPQLVNVLAGDMSFVGPRPEVWKYVDKFRGQYSKLLSVRPGITDPASIAYSEEEKLTCQSEKSEDTYLALILPEKIRLSSDYIEKRGLLKDIGLIITTVFKSWRHKAE